ncbi:MAG: divalent-cation tolerance protein CutA [Proteobacteria bacterium]|nr:divalent-cation tolerance protein CutA [Pseudomonadota bacterium]
MPESTVAPRVTSEQGGHRLVYVTAPNRDTALALGRSLVQQRLAACANVLEPMTSIYWWHGQLEEDTEAVLIAKTPAERVAALIEHLEAAHPYECPCIVALPIMQGFAPYLRWLEAETSC